MSDPTTDQPGTVYAITQVATPAHHGTMLSLRDVADRLGVSLVTVRRNVRAGRYDGAVLEQGPHGETWQVPLATVESLLSAPPASRPQRTPAVQAAPAQQALLAELAALRSQVQQLSVQLATEQAVSRERADQLDQLHSTMRTLAITAQSSSTAPARRWWKRRPS